MRSSPKAFNVPAVVLALAASFVAVHIFRSVISPRADLTVILEFAFIPARYVLDAATTGILPGGAGAKIWTFLTYGFLHADITHLAVNSFWMLAFGSVVARRLGASRFLLFSAVCAIAGVMMHLAARWGDPVPVIGASAAISGQMAGAIRFIFAPDRGRWRGPGTFSADHAPASLRDVFRNPRALVFLGVWAAINLIAGLGALNFANEGGQIAWEAHIGGFVAGLLLFGFFDRPRKSPHSSDISEGI